MTATDRAVQVLRDTLDRIWGYDAPTWAADIATDLRDAGLITPEPRIIRTREELADLDPDALVVTDLTFTHGWRIRHEKCAYRAADAHRLDLTWHGPLVVIATGDEVRAARQALEAGE